VPVVNFSIGHPAEELHVVRSSRVRIKVVGAKKLPFAGRMMPALSPPQAVHLSDLQFGVEAVVAVAVVALVFVNALVCAVQIFLPILEFYAGMDSVYMEVLKMKE
jgi:hypothetical protein